MLTAERTGTGIPPDLAGFRYQNGAALRAALGGLLDRARAGQEVEVGCLGAHGRTGTALACAAVLAGVAPDDAVEWVKSNYCERAVETPEQMKFVADFRRD